MRSCIYLTSVNLRDNAMPKLSRFVPKMGTILPVLGIATFVAGCATPPPLPTSFSGQCLIQPVAAQQGVMLANVHCEKAE